MVIRLSLSIVVFLLGYGCGDFGVGGRYQCTDSLLELSRCMPVTARCYEGDWARVVTPLKVVVWEKRLQNHSDRDFVRFICDGIREGFRVGYNGRVGSCVSAVGNLRSVVDHPEVVGQYIHAEREVGRLIGPFDRSAFPWVQTSPFGVIPKSEPGKWRLIVDLSAPLGFSVNDGIERRLCSVSYMSVDEVVDRVLEVGQGALLAKFDLRSAYRNIPIHPDDRRLLGMVWEGQLYVDVVLPFGLRSAPKIFNAVADALAFIIGERGVEWLRHYLDDFVIVGPPGSVQCGDDLKVALGVCDETGFPVAVKKTKGPVTLLEVLGIEVDSEAMVVRLPSEKLVRLEVGG